MGVENWDSLQAISKKTPLLTPLYFRLQVNLDLHSMVLRPDWVYFAGLCKSESIWSRRNLKESLGPTLLEELLLLVFLRSEL